MTLISVKMAAWRHRAPRTAALFHEKAGISTENRHLTTKSASSDDFNAFVESSVPTLVRNDLCLTKSVSMTVQSTVFPVTAAVLWSAVSPQSINLTTKGTFFHIFVSFNEFSMSNSVGNDAISTISAPLLPVLSFVTPF